MFNIINGIMQSIIFLFVQEEASLGMMLLEAFQVQDDGRGSEESMLPVGLYTFLIEVLYFLKMVDDDRGSTFNHSARIRPALPGLQVLISRFSAASYKDLSQV